MDENILYFCAEDTSFVIIEIQVIWIYENISYES